MFCTDTSSTLGSITSIVSSSDTATVTTGSAHGLSVGMYVHIQQLHLERIQGCICSKPTTFTYAQNLVRQTELWPVQVIYKPYHIVKDVSIPANSTLKIVSGQKMVLNANDKVYAYASEYLWYNRWYSTRGIVIGIHWC